MLLSKSVKQINVKDNSEYFRLIGLLVEIKYEDTAITDLSLLEILHVIASIFSGRSEKLSCQC